MNPSLRVPEANYKVSQVGIDRWIREPGSSHDRGSLPVPPFLVVFPKVPVFLFRSKSGHVGAYRRSRRSRREIPVREPKGGWSHLGERGSPYKASSGCPASIRNPLSSRSLFPTDSPGGFAATGLEFAVRLRAPRGPRGSGASSIRGPPERVFRVMRKRARTVARFLSTSENYLLERITTEMAASSGALDESFNAVRTRFFYKMSPFAARTTLWPVSMSLCQGIVGWGLSVVIVLGRELDRYALDGLFLAIEFL